MSSQAVFILHLDIFTKYRVFNMRIDNKSIVVYLCFSLYLSFCPLYRPLLKQIKNSAESHIVLDCSTEKIYDVLKQAQQIGMMSDYHSYLITSLVKLSYELPRSHWLPGANVLLIIRNFQDLHTIDLDEFKYGGTNITGFRLVNPDTPMVQKVLKQWVRVGFIIRLLCMRN